MKIFIAIILLPIYINSNNSFVSECNNNIQAVIHKLKPKKKNNYNYYFLDFQHCNKNSNLDSLLAANILYMSSQAEKDIYILTTENDTIRPTTYLYEGNVEKIRPYYRVILGFEKNKRTKGKYLKIDIPNLNFKIDINNDL
jgi:hypothetical protein